MTRIFHLARRQVDMPSHQGWLTPAERAYASRFRVAKRRRDWLLGRWTAKLTLARGCGRSEAELHRWQVLPDADRVPCVSFDEGPCVATVSISHSHGTALCAVAPDGAAVGCDLERIAERDDAFVDTFFTAAERRAATAATGQRRATLATLIWSAKESALKAIHKGLSVDTRSIEVTPPPIPPRADRWQPLHACRAGGGAEFAGWWRHDGEFVWTILGGEGRPEPTLVAAQPDVETRNRLTG